MAWPKGGWTLVFYGSLAFLVQLAEASIGDRLDVFYDCNHQCLTDNCSYQKKIERFKATQPAYLALLGWDCYEECKYQCQWETIQFLLSDEIGLPANELPQFYGKVTKRS